MDFFRALSVKSITSFYSIKGHAAQILQSYEIPLNLSSFDSILGCLANYNSFMLQGL